MIWALNLTIFNTSSQQFSSNLSPLFARLDEDAAQPGYSSSQVWQRDCPEWSDLEWTHFKSRWKRTKDALSTHSGSLRPNWKVISHSCSSNNTNLTSLTASVWPRCVLRWNSVTLKVQDYAKLVLVMFSNNDVSPSVNESIHSLLLLKPHSSGDQPFVMSPRGTDTSTRLVTTQPGVGSIP